jgi:ABC-2 type transport system permease protein
MKRVKAVAVKEFSHILRDPTSLTIIFLMPLVMMFIFGYSISFDMEEIETGIIDLSGGEIAQNLVAKFSNNRYFKVEDLRKTFPDSNPIEGGERLLKSGRLKQMIILPPDFSHNVQNRKKAHLGTVIDGSDSNVANLVYQYNEMVVVDFMSEYQDLKKLLKLNTKILFNPEVKSSFFFIPGLIAILLVMISAILTSISITREKESGSIDLIFISPLKSPEIILGKTFPYIFVAFIAEGLILVVARFWFGVPFRGSLSVLLLFSLLYIIAGLSMGILISAVTSSQKAAMFAALLSTMLPSIMLSGFIFPLDSMAKPLQMISRIVPATYFLEIIRGVVVKGAEIKHFMAEGIALVIFSTLLLTIAGIKFSKDRKRAK